MSFRNNFNLSLLSIAVFYCSAIAAANISGTVKNSSNSPAVAAKVSFNCPKNSEARRTVTTDKYGRYRITGLPNTNWCSMQVNLKPYDSNSIDINSGTGSKSINIKLKLNKTKNGWDIKL